MKNVLVINQEATLRGVAKSLTRLLMGKETARLITNELSKERLKGIILEAKAHFEQMGYQVVKRQFSKMSFDQLKIDKPKGFFKYATYIVKINDRKEVK